MIQIFRTNQNTKKLEELSAIEKDCWVHMTCPTNEEIEKMSGELKLPAYIFTDPLDADEGSRSEIEKEYVFIILRLPFKNEGEEGVPYITAPIGIVITKDNVVTITSQNSAVLSDFISEKIKNFSTQRKQKLVLQIFLNSATLYLKFLKEINKSMNIMEVELRKSLNNREMFKLLSLKKSLVFFATSLKANEIMIERLEKLQTFRSNTEEKNLLEDVLITAALKASDSMMDNLFEKIEKNQIFLINTEEETLLDDVIIENKQALEMVNIYSNILTGLMDSFSSLISNNLNTVMKVLTYITISIMFPNFIVSIFSVNTAEFPHNTMIFSIAGAVILPVIIIFFLAKAKKL